MKVVVLHNQTMLDLAVRYCGSADAAFDISVINPDFDVTDFLEPGTEIEIPEKNFGRQDIVNYFDLKGQNPASDEPSIITSSIDYFPGLPGILPLMLS